MIINKKLSCLLAFFIGLVLVSAFSPMHFYLVALALPAGLYALISRAKPTCAATIGLCFGLGFFGTGISWVFVSIYTFGGTSFWIALLITFLFVLVLSCFFALLGFLLQYFSDTKTKLLLVYPALWAILEAIRSWIFTGFPWLLLGHSITNSPFSGLAPIVGVYGCSFVLVFISGLLYLSCIPPWANSNKALLGLCLTFALGYAAQFIPWTNADKTSLRVALVQGNIQQSLRWDPQEVNNILTTYSAMTQGYYHNDLIVWPEAAIPLTPEEAQPYLMTIRDQLAATHSALLTGIPFAYGVRYYNSVMGLGAAEGTYSKRHLVPFGEYVPFERWLRGLIQFFNLPMSNLVPGNDNPHLIRVHEIPVGVYICYEVAYGNVVRQDLPRARLLITVSDDAWFGKSLAPSQHLQIGQFQALASGRPMLFVGNDGITAIINAHGGIDRLVEPFFPRVLQGSVKTYSGTTPWVALGDSFWLILMFIVLGVCLARERKKKLG